MSARFLLDIYIYIYGVAPTCKVGYGEHIGQVGYLSAFAPSRDIVF